MTSYPLPAAHLLRRPHPFGKVLFAFAVMLCLGSSLVLAQGKPDVTGTWKMNKEKSKFDGGSPDAITFVFAQQDQNLTETLTVMSPNGEQKFDMKYTLDGKETPFSMGGRQAKTTANWKGNSLVLLLKADEGWSLQRTISLSEDGKSMTVTVNRQEQDGPKTDTIVMEKQ